MTQTQMKEMSAVETAENRIKSLREALANGDEKIKASDLMTARNELEFAELKAQAAEISKQKAIEAERRTTLLELQTRLKVIADSHKTIDAKLESFTRSLHEYLTTCTTFQNNLNSVRTALREADLYPESDVIVAGVTPGKVTYGVSVLDRMRTLTIGETSATSLAPGESIKTVVEQAVADYERNF
jgi:small-conductance mechanosensitive channel